MTTIATYLSITKNLSRTQARTAAEPAVKTASAYYAANIGKITSIKQFVGNYRLLSYALDAYGLGSQINSTALIKKVLEGGVANSKALANTLPQWKAFATAFDFVGKGAASISTATAIAATKQNYIEQQLENDEGQQDVGVQLALYFHRVAPNVTSAFGILADKNLLQVVETIFGLPTSFSAESIDTQAKVINGFFKISDLHNPIKLNNLTQRFTAQYDSLYGPSSGSTATLTVAGSNSPSSTSASAGALAVLGGIVSSNASNLSAAGGILSFSDALMQSLQGFKIGG
jgi:hypothetical protein